MCELSGVNKRVRRASKAETTEWPKLIFAAAEGESGSEKKSVVLYDCNPLRAYLHDMYPSSSDVFYCRQCHEMFTGVAAFRGAGSKSFSARKREKKMNDAVICYWRRAQLLVRSETFFFLRGTG